MAYKIVFFDCDGVLTTNTSSWLVLHKYFGSIDNSYFAKLYEEGKISYLHWMVIDIALMINAWGKPIHRRDVEKALDTIGIREETTFIGKVLKQRGYILAVISSGIDHVVKKACRALSADICLYNELVYDEDEYLVPGGKTWVPLKEKHILIEKVVEGLGFSMEDVVYVGDSKWDIPVFEKVGLSIAVEPCGEACAHADYVVSNLAEILKIL